MTHHHLSDLLDLTAVKKLVEANYQATGMPIGVVDAQDGSVLIGTGWQNICAQFHRANPASAKRCEESDQAITNQLAKGEVRQYKCLNGLWDIGIPIVVAGQHLATLFLGQFFYEGETPEREFFIQQAREFGYDLDSYLAALDQVRFFSRERVDSIVAYNAALAGFIADLAEQALRKLKADEDLRFANMLLRTQQETSLDGILVVDEAGKIVSYNQRFIDMWQIPPDVIASKSDEQALRAVSDRLADPAEFMTRVNYLYQHRAEHSHDELRLKDGLTFERYSAPIFGSDEQYFGRVWYVRDITARQHAELLIQLRLRLIDFANSHSLAELLQNMLDEICDLTNSPIGFFHFVEADQQTLSLQAWSTQTQAEFCRAEGEGLHYSLDQAGVWADCARERRPIIHNDYRSLPQRKGLPEGHAEVVRELVVPIIRGDRIVAILGIGNRPQDYTEQDVAAVSYVADLIWEIIDRKQTEQMLKMFQYTVDQASDAVQWLNREARFEYVNDAACRSLGYTREELMRLTLWDVDPTYPKERWEQSWTKGREGGENKVESLHRRKDGSLFPVEVTAKALWMGDQELHVAVVRDITERKRAEGALRESQQMLRNVLEQFPGVVFWKDRQSIYLGCNRAFSTAAGLAAPAQIVGKTDFDLPWADTEAASYRADDSAVMSGGQPRLNIIEPQHQADGRLAWFDTSKVPLFDERGQVFGVLGASRDITECKRAEAALQQAALIVENSPVMLFRWRAAEGWPVVLVSQNVTQFGYAPEELLSGAVMFSSIIYPSDLARVNHEVQTYTANGVDRFQQEYRIVTKVGQVRWVEDRTAVERDDAGQVTHYQGIVVDITEHKQAEEALRASEAKLQLTLEAARLGDWSWDFVTGDVVWSAQCKALYGLPPDVEITYERFLECIHPEHREDIDAALKRAVETKGDYDVEKRVVWPDGSIHWTASRGRVFCDANSQPVRLTGVTLDITERKQAEEALQASEERFRSLIRNSSDVTSVLSAEGITLYQSPALKRVLGYDPDQFIGIRSLAYVHPDDSAAARQAYLDVIAHPAVAAPVEYRYRRADGSWAYLETIISNHLDDPTIKGIVLNSRDVTERKRAEAQTERALRETRMRFEVSQGLAGKETEDEVLDALIQLASFYPKAFVVITTVDRQDGELVGIVRRQNLCESGLTAAMSVGDVLPASHYPLVNDFFTDRPLVSGDIGNDERFEAAGRQLLTQTGAVSFAAVPLVAGKEQIGYVTVMAKAPDYFDEEKQHLYETLAEQGAVALRAARLRETIRESQQRLSLLVHQSPLAIIEWDLTMHVVSWNPAAERTFGYTAEAAIGCPIDLIVPNAVRSQIDSVWPAILTHKDGWHNTNENLTQDGRLITCDWFNAPLIGADGQAIGVVSFAQDITERKQLDARLLASEARYRALVESQVDLISRYRFDTTLTFVNDAYCQFYGRTREELLGQSWLFMVAPEDREQTLKETERFRQDPRPLSGEYLNFRSDGAVCWIQWVIQGIVDDNGQVVELQATGRDITQLKQAEEVIRELSRKNEEALRVAHMGHWEFDVASGLFLFNDQYYAVHGITAAEAGGYQLTAEEFAEKYVHPADARLVSGSIYQALSSTEPNFQTQFEGRILRGNGEPRHVTVWFRLERDQQGQPIKLYGVNQDVTERKQAELERERLIVELERKNAELERFTYTVSHDLKSPLITIKGFLGFLEKAALAGNIEQLRSDIARISEAAKKMERLLSELLELSRIGRILNPPEVVPFESIAREAVELVRGQLNTRQATVTIAESLPAVYGDRARLVEVVQNLVDNAVKFMGEQPNPHIEIGGQAETGAQPVFYVRDNGQGIESQYHQRIFGLFDKLDARSEGTGVGLALVKRIIEVHGGRIWVESDGYARGATFYFTLPGADLPARPER